MKIRTITSFVTLRRDERQWRAALERAVDLNAAARAAAQAAGYEVQTTRIITSPFPDYMDCSNEAAAVASCGKLLVELSAADRAGLKPLLNVGIARTPEHAALIPALVAAHGVTASAAVGADDNLVPDAVMCHAAASVITRIATSSADGAGNFCFCASFNAAPGIPFFPAGYHEAAAVAGAAGVEASCSVDGFALGLQFPDALVAALEQLAAGAADVLAAHAGDKGKAWAAAAACMQAALVHHYNAIAKAMAVVSGAHGGIPFRGVDGSLAPSPDARSITDVYRLLGVKQFGGAGTLEASAFLTRVLKAAVAASAAPAVGYTGLMLPPLEDTGLAAAAAAGRLRIAELLSASAVCGVGLDTVPIAGSTPTARIAALMGDVGALAWRLNKPLSVRLFPVPGLAAGDATTFDSPYLCNGRVFEMP